MKRHRKPYTKADAIRKFTRLMDDHEFMSDTEIKDRKRRIAAIMYMENGRLIKQEKDERKRGYCPKCYMLRNTQGRCLCDDIADMKAKEEQEAAEARKKREA